MRLLLLWLVEAHGGKRLLRTEDFPVSLSRDIFVTVDDSGGVDCTWSDWSSWSFCSASCGVGRHQRKRWVAVRAQGGKSCEGPAEEQEECSSPCAGECRWDNWQDWSSCTASCGGGLRQRSRALAGNRSACRMSDGQQEEPCGETPCVNCWAEWSSCSLSCGGVRVRRNKEGCPTNSEEELCEACRCKLGDWSAWGPCEGPCLNSKASSVRTRENEGASCNATVREEKSCDCTKVGSGLNASEGPLGPVDCTWDQWQDWQACTVSCGKGSTKRLRHVAQLANDLGRDCAGEDRQTKPCQGGACPSCETSEWSTWSECTGPCMYHSSRSVRAREPMKPGPCDKSLEEERACSCDHPEVSGSNTRFDKNVRSIGQEEEAEPIDCEWSSWEDWEVCSQSCGGGITRRLREVRRAANGLGSECAGDARQTRNCQDSACPCRVGDWSDWSSCAGDCDGAADRAVRTRELEGDQSHCMETLEQEKACSCAHEDHDDTLTAADLRAQNLNTGEAQVVQASQNPGDRRVSGALELHLADPVAFSSDPSAETAAQTALSELIGHQGTPSVSLMPKDNKTVDCWYSLVLPEQKANAVAAKLHEVELSEASTCLGTELQRIGVKAAVSVAKVTATVTATNT